MEILLLTIAVGALNIVCFYIGAKVGQKVSKDEPIGIPSVNPVKVYREEQSRKEAEKEQIRRNTIMENIEAYDGTGAGQKDVN